jgi:hypothetical protein
LNGRSNLVSISIDGKSVSRNHAEIVVSPAPNGSCFHTSTRSQITVKDLDTKFGTFVNEVQVARGGSTVLPNSNSCNVRIGKATTGQTTLHITWNPVVFTFSTGEQAPIHQKIQADLTNKLEHMDIKLLSDFHPSTTHFLKTARNSSKVLYALVKTIPIASIDYATAVSNTADSLEQDYSAFPDPALYLPDEKFAINPARRNLFQGMTFLFGETNQRDALLPVIGAAGGKALLYELTQTTSAQNIRDFVNAKCPTAIMVKYPTNAQDPRPEDIERLLRMNEASKLLGVYLVDAVEFLDAVQNASVGNLGRRRTPNAVHERSLEIKSEPQKLSHGNSLLQASIKVEPQRIRRGRQKQLNLLDVFTGGEKKEIVQPAGQTANQSAVSCTTTNNEPPVERKGVLGRRRVEKVSSNLLDPLDFDPAPNARESKRRKIQHQQELAVAAPTTELEADLSSNLEPINEDEDFHPEPSRSQPESEPNMEEIELSKLGNLAIVENSFPIERPLSARTPVQAYHGVPNFKKFRKSMRGSGVGVSEVFVQLVEAPSVNARTAQDVKYMFALQDRPQQDHRPAKRPKLDTDRSLFVCDSETESPGLFTRTSSTTQSIVKARTDDSDDDDDDDDNDELKFKFTS